MKRVLLLIMIAALLSACADSSTVGTGIEKEYNFDLTVTNNTEMVIIKIPVTVAADTENQATQDTADKASITATPDTNLNLDPTGL